MKKVCLFACFLLISEFTFSQWTALSSGISATLESVCFTDANTGFVVGHNGSILKTNNGGTTWMALSSGTTKHLYSVFFTDTRTGYAVGDSGIILKTTNGEGYPLGINNQLSLSNTLIVYPNHTSSQITIETSAIGTQNQLTISDLRGQELITRQITETKTQIDISSLPSGVYIVKNLREKGVQVGKFIKQ